jgi:hypothetical protein
LPIWIDWGTPPEEPDTALQRNVVVNQLQRDLCANADPVKDRELMRRVVAAGPWRTGELLAHLGSEHPRQVYALLCATSHWFEMNKWYGAYEDWVAAIDTALDGLGPQLGSTFLDWSEAPELAAVRTSLQHAVLTCGGDVVHEYARLKRELPVQQPLRLPPPPYDSAALARIKRAISGKSELGPSQRAADGTVYTAFCIDIPTAGQVLLGIDTDNDVKFEEVLPTGLLDVSDYAPPAGLGRETLHHTGQPLSLTLNWWGLRIGHDAPQFQPQATGHSWTELSGSRHVFTTLKLARLRRDSDQDGFTDITEQLLALDPRNPDSDADGLGDAVDPAPNVSAAGQGKLERGVHRLLLEQDALLARFNGWHERVDARGSLPFGAWIVSVEDALPPNYALAGQRTIWLNRSRLAQLPILDDDAWLAQSGQAQSPDAPERSSEPGPWVHFQRGNPGCEPAESVRLVEIDGELYPLRPLGNYDL